MKAEHGSHLLSPGGITWSLWKSSSASRGCLTLFCRTIIAMRFGSTGIIINLFK